MLPTEMGNNKTISVIVTVIVCGVSDAKVSNSVQFPLLTLKVRLHSTHSRDGLVQ